MFKKFALLILSFLPLFAFSQSYSSYPPSYQENLQVGRFQMVGVTTDTKIQLYLLDTATGYVWKSVRKNNWVDHDHWELQIRTIEKP
jgi:hypothetical protein